MDGEYTGVVQRISQVEEDGGKSQVAFGVDDSVAMLC